MIYNIFFKKELIYIEDFKVKERTMEEKKFIFDKNRECLDYKTEDELYKRMSKQDSIKDIFYSFELNTCLIFIER